MPRDKPATVIFASALGSWLAQHRIEWGRQRKPCAVGLCRCSFIHSLRHLNDNVECRIDVGFGHVE
jgi:hypothetical protein